ncbi:UDP-N-acetylglucosamine--peptide N-acetylglucosaminyltransferase 110 kDa subunit-like, partial [Aphis craccivora]
MTLGDIYLEKSDLENAKNAFYTALYLTPENADGHWKLGLTMHKLGHFDLAILRVLTLVEGTYLV